jgi:hypothetical protein
MAAGHVYHWKHGWIPLTYFAALQKAHGSRSGAISALHASAGVHGSESPGRYYGGIHSGMAAARTYAKLSQQGIAVASGRAPGTTIYWRHPGTGRQVKAKIVGIEHTGHIIIQHSGNRNALIGHSTYSLTPHADTPEHDVKKAGAFANPHVHTRPVEQDANGNPVGYKPRASRPASTRGRTVIERNFPPKNIDAPPTLTPKAPAFAPLPEHFTPIDPKTITPYHTISAMARMKEGSKIRQAYSLGHHKVLIQSALTKAQTEGLLNDIKDTLHQAHPTIGDKPVTFLVPTGDRQFRTTSRGTVLGYVIRGGSTVHIHPKVASGEYESIAGKDSFMAAAKSVGTRRYTITHELGHVVDNMQESNRTDRAGMFHEGVQHFQANRKNMSTYGSHSITEGYAEAFAQHQLGADYHGRHHAIANEYARIYGWKKASSK